MPIKFRCSHCQQFLGISRSKASTLTDCPTCGRTIRVPSLDGTVAPVPSPKLNLEDSELRNALGALADLDGDPTVESGEELEIASAVFKPSLHQEEESFHAVVAEPIASPEAVPEELAVEAEPNKSGESLSPLSELANAEYAIPIIEPEEENRDRVIRFVLLAVLGGGLFAIGFLIGRATAPLATESVAEIEEIKVGVKEIPVQAADANIVEEAAAQVRGRITYETVTGDQRADNGARVLVLPLEISVDELLVADGFRVGATEAEQEDFADRVSALGGEFVVSDADGRYTISELLPGEYGVLIGSRFQSRDDANQHEPEVVEFLSKYIKNTNRVLGRVQYMYRQVTVEKKTGKDALVIDQYFEAE